MLSRRPSSHDGNGHGPIGPLPVRQPLGPDAQRGLASNEIDWDRWARHVESRRRRLQSSATAAAIPARIFGSREYLAEATYATFRLEGLEVTEAEVGMALARGRGTISVRRAPRSRQAQRLRNHAACVRSVDGQIASGLPLTPNTYLRWYASISNGLCPADLDDSTSVRLTEQLQRMNFPELRPAAAIQGIARVHAALLRDPLVPSFNGILARLLLRYHLGRCYLPPVFFNPDIPPAALANERHLLPVLMECLEHTFDVLVAGV